MEALQTMAVWGKQEHSCEWKGPCLALWCSAERKDEGGWVSGSNLLIHLRMRKRIDPCVKPPLIKTAQLVYGRTVQLTFNLADAIGPCGETGLSAKPVITAAITIRRPYGLESVVKYLESNKPVTLPDDPVRLVMDDHGVLEIALKADCRWYYSPAPPMAASK